MILTGGGGGEATPPSNHGKSVGHPLEPGLGDDDDDDKDEDESGVRGGNKDDILSIIPIKDTPPKNGYVGNKNYLERAVVGETVSSGGRTGAGA